ncbi:MULTISPECIES: RDD family protein [Clostridium]|uniref:RDD family protein n=1 Tax=Clostridium cibarium TaxID=2762247 RepID=A0ABR8PRA2_9CLOT|nr:MULTISPECIES: RDD family protein [Clostridium]MBD7910614.1 RDD family protein [Clostridium cibarium]
MIKRLFASLLDQMITFICSVAILFLAELILKVIGFKVNTHEIFLLIFYFVVNVLYFSILENGKNGTSLGKRILKIK